MRNFTKAEIRSLEILKFIERIQVEHEPKFEGNNGKYRVACRLVVRLKDGASHETTVLFRKGSPEDPMMGEQLREKFRTLAERMGARRSEQIGAIVSHIEDCKNSCGTIASADDRGIGGVRVRWKIRSSYLRRRERARRAGFNRRTPLRLTSILSGAIEKSISKDLSGVS